MLAELPSYIVVVFVLTTLATLMLFYGSIKNAEAKNAKARASLILIGIVFWLVIQSYMTLNSFYNTDTTRFPPNFILLIFPPLLAIVIIFLTQKGRSFVDSLPLSRLTYLHVVRIPVELVLYWLFLYGTIPELMTFTGRNFDILAGITAPFVAYYGLRQIRANRKAILIWNLICLGLLLNIVINAVLSAPFVFQKFAFDQPNIAVLYFPFSWLPAFIVPTVLLSHLASIRQLLISKPGDH